jgi:hypothetical protein
MNGTIPLFRKQFAENEQKLLEYGTLRAYTFRYKSGVEAIRMENDKGSLVLLPFMGQMIWSMNFLGQSPVMRSTFDEPLPNCAHYGETYGCFLMHCGLSAMGNPTAEDTHLPHGELPIAQYREAHLSFGEDERGAYLALSGTYTRQCAFEIHYDFCPECGLYENASLLDLTVRFTNRHYLPLEYFYLCHINYLPVDGARLHYTAKRENIIVHDEIPSNYPREIAEKTKAHLERLRRDPAIMDTIDSETQSYAPEIVFTCRYEQGADGVAHTLEELPNGYGCYVSHRPSELPFGIRWISRTRDEDALGMVLPATAEHKGYLDCKRKGYERYLAPSESMTFHIQTGILSPVETQEMIQKINNI